MATKEPGGQQRANRRADAAEEQEETPVASTGENLAERQEKLTDDVDAMLDDIDAALEENAEDFVKAYVQKGGQ